MVKKVRVIDLFNVKYNEMEDKINSALADLQNGGASINETKVIGDSLNKCAVFVLYEE